MKKNKVTKSSEMKEDKLYGFYYNPMIYESGDCLISLHRTKKGAEMALDYHKHEKKKEYDDYSSWNKEEGTEPECKFGEFERWYVDEIEINE